eukprot:9388077-Prorocentrum_lima.AAC.1
MSCSMQAPDVEDVSLPGRGCGGVEARGAFQTALTCQPPPPIQQALLDPSTPAEAAGGAA